MPDQGSSRHDHPLHRSLFATGGLATFIALDHQGSGEVPDEQYPYVLITGRIREHYNNGSMTRRSQGISEVVPEELVEIHPDDAQTLNIAHGDWLKVVSRRGEVKVRAKVSDRSRIGSVFMTFHHQKVLTNILTSSHRDPITGTPEYKSCAVRIEPLSKTAVV